MSQTVRQVSAKQRLGQLTPDSLSDLINLWRRGDLGLGGQLSKERLTWLNGIPFFHTLGAWRSTGGKEEFAGGLLFQPREIYAGVSRRVETAVLSWFATDPRYVTDGIARDLAMEAIRYCRDELRLPFVTTMLRRPRHAKFFGFGCATRSSVRVLSRTAVGSPPDDCQVRVAWSPLEDLTEVGDLVEYRHRNAHRVGQLLSTDLDLAVAWMDIQGGRLTSPFVLRVFDTNEELRGFCVAAATTSDQSSRTLQVLDFAVDDDYHLAAWQHLCKRVPGSVHTGPRPTDELIMNVTPNPERPIQHVLDGLYLRVLDPRQALEARHYWSNAQARIEVVDDMIESNSGTFDLEIMSGRASVGRSSERPEVIIHVRWLATVLLGSVRWETLRQAGLLHECVPHACARLDSCFAPPLQPHHGLNV